MRTLCAGVLAVLAVGGPALAQEAPSAPPAAATPVPAEGSHVVVTPGQTSTTTIYQPFGWPAPGTDINAELPSSARPINGDEQDGFDLAPSNSGSSVAHGDPGAPGILDEGSVSGSRTLGRPSLHVVRRGDTLWGLSAQYFESPWEWPKLWRQNEQIRDPHWIYPGDQIRLNATAPIGSAAAALRAPGIHRSRTGPSVPSGAVYLREQGFIGDPERDVWGEIVGAVEEQMLLAAGNHVYLVIEEGNAVKPGQELTVFRTVRQPEAVPGARKPPGRIVRVNGTVRIDAWSPKTRIARAVITESLDVIERGAKVGPVRRKFEIVEARANKKKVEARVLTSFYPHVYLAQNQIVFLDRGSSDGLEPGNTLVVMRRGDTWRKSLATSSSMMRDRLNMDSPERVEIEKTPLVGNESKFPPEAVAELRVLRTEPKSSVALVVHARRELVPGDRAIAAVAAASRASAKD